MKEIRQELTEQKIEHAMDDARRRELTFKAQAAILDENLSERRKDEVVGYVVGELLRIAEKRGFYNTDGGKR